MPGRIVGSQAAQAFADRPLRPHSRTPFTPSILGHLYRQAKAECRGCVVGRLEHDTLDCVMQDLALGNMSAGRARRWRQLGTYHTPPNRQRSLASNRCALSGMNSGMLPQKQGAAPGRWAGIATLLLVCCCRKKGLSDASLETRGENPAMTGNTAQRSCSKARKKGQRHGGPAGEEPQPRLHRSVAQHQVSQPRLPEVESEQGPQAVVPLRQLPIQLGDNEREPCERRSWLTVS